MLIGRAPEQRTLEALAAGARVGRSGVLVVVGEAGCGKTALLDHLAATIHDMDVCRVVGTEAERDLGFGGLSQLVGVQTGAVEELPEPQARALAVALNLRTGTDVDRMAVGAGTLGLLSRRAESQPLAVLLDDAHLLDHSSAQAITFAARRLLADPILLVAAVRAGEDSPLLSAGLPVLELGGLGTAAAGELLSERSGRRFTAGQIERLVRATRGNPLALLELGDDLEALDSLGPDDPVAVRSALARSFLSRTGKLTAAARSALVVAACSSGDPLVVHGACRALGIDHEGLAEAADARLIAVTGTIEFRHPLVRAAVVGAAAPEELRAVHAALAEATAADDPDGRTWHLAAAASGPDDEVAAALDRVAVRARERSAYDVASSALERAGWLASSPGARGARLLEAAECGWISGQGQRALTLLEQAGEPGSPDLVARAGHLHGTIAVRTGSIPEAIKVFSSAAQHVQASHPDAAAELWADAVTAALTAADTRFLRVAATALTELEPRLTDARSRILGALATGMALTLTGGGGADRIRASVHHLATSDTLRADPMRAQWLVLGPLFLREEGRYRALVQEASTETRAAAAIGELAHLLWLVALDDAASDGWSRADSEFQESVALARELGHTTDLALALAGLASLDARMGRGPACREHAVEAIGLCAEKDIVIGRVWARLALGELELGAGRAEEALVELDQVDAILSESGLQDMDIHPGPARVEALMRLGRVDEATRVGQELHRLSTAKGQAWALARAERALGMVAEGEAADEHFAMAAQLHDGTPDQFEAALTALAHGASLRRRRRRRDARVLLRAALEGFEQLGAAQRAEQAAVELTATGETAQRRGASKLTTLTAQERQIAELLSEGQTTRAAATALFLSPKTVEYHLRHVYTKLGVRSRAELTEALAEH
ncbi:helix-turn-helix transcriptional regulator [Ornithinimicrobium cryptoxanthini]|uniref:helix-turn-helix transcriptional regulator n=1 Tax=Ornithinimicrobium cryptoxanthini TaxID=2934161 RepID=UPI002119A5B2|nr:LuxR family transcriptional regulator [Ornithinimicrobium cryptoxanthini]